MAMPKDIKDRIVDFLREREYFHAPNRIIYESLGLDIDEFFEARNELVFQGYIERGRGQGGSSTLLRMPSNTVMPEVASPSEADVDGTAVDATDLETPNGEQSLDNDLVVSTEREQDVYQPILEKLKDEWRRDQSIATGFATISANNKRGGPGGSWSVPDLVMWGKRSFKFIKDPVISVYTFEVKLAKYFDIRTIFEAAAHRIVSNYSYAVVVGEKSNDLESRTSLACGQTGVGLIWIEDAGDYNTWEEMIEPKRHEPDPEMFESFVQWSLAEYESDIIMAMK